MRNKIRGVWSTNLLEIYKKILIEIGDEEHYAELFYESTAVLLSNLLRSLATQALQNYESFIQRFDKGDNRLPQQIILEEAQNYLAARTEEFFLKIELEDDGQRIVFCDDLNNVRERLLTLAMHCV